MPKGMTCLEDACKGCCDGRKVLSRLVASIAGVCLWSSDTWRLSRVRDEEETAVC